MHERRRGDVLTDTDQDVQRQLDAYCDGHAGSMFASLAGEVGKSNAEDDLVTRETQEGIRAALARALDALHPRDRELVDLHYLKARPLTEVAQILRVSYPTAHRVRTRTLERLGALLRGAGVTEMPPEKLEGP